MRTYPERHSSAVKPSDQIRMQHQQRRCYLSEIAVLVLSCIALTDTKETCRIPPADRPTWPGLPGGLCPVAMERPVQEPESQWDFILQRHIEAGQLD